MKPKYDIKWARERRRRKAMLMKAAARSGVELTDDQFEAAVESPGNQFEHHLHDLSKIDVGADPEKALKCLKDNLKSKFWRMNNLYYIIDKHGIKVLFRFNAAQTRLFNNLWYFNIILKARQLGFTTFICIYFLDDALFNPDLECGIVAHNFDDVKKIFRRKIKYPYDNLPAWLKEGRTPKTDSISEMSFKENSSIISVAVSYRSGTCQRLLISEFGKICAKYPEKAREIKTGTLEAIHPGSIAFIESTAEGKGGDFYDYCQIARNMQIEKKPLSHLDFKFHFFAWWQDPDNVLETATPITTQFKQYFEEIGIKIGINLTLQQNWWYIKKKERLGDDMKREHPSTPDEAFEVSIKGAYFTEQFVFLRKNKRITKVPIDPNLLVHTAWDLGMNDVMAIWFFQVFGREVRNIDYYQNSGYGFGFYAKVLEKRGYRYGRHFGPHDLNVRLLDESTQGRTRMQAARNVGIRFERVPRIKDKLDSIEAARTLLPMCWFDEERCSEGLTYLENYRKEWNEATQTYKTHPLHDENSNAADAFQTEACAPIFAIVGRGSKKSNTRKDPDGWT